MPRHLPSRDEILVLFREERRALSAAEIATALNVAPTSERGLLRLLDNLVLSGDLEGDASDRFSEPKPAQAKPKATVADAKPREVFRQKKGLPASGKGQNAGASGRAQPPVPNKGRPKREPRSDKPVREGLPAPAEMPGFSEARTKRTGSDNEREGTLTISPRGFGFVATQGSAGDDVYIPKESIAGGMHGDRVRVAVGKRSARGVEGEVVEVLDRRNKRVAGTLRRRGKSAWLEPDDARIRSPIPLPNTIDTRATEGNSGEDGDAAVVSISRYPTLPDELPEGKLEAVLGKPGELNVEVAKILVREQIEEVHSEEAFKEAEAYGPTVPEAMLEGREDLTHLPLPTIDPEDARDHDDAVWVERSKQGGYRAYVAIADVSSYVVPGTRIDAEALARGCSIYLPDRAIPMLPRPLSSNLCSLLPDVVRLCLCAEIEMDGEGNVFRSRIIRGFMKSQAKLTYGNVARALGLTELPPAHPKAEELLPGLKIALDLSRILRAKRMKRGALDLDLPEAKITLGEGGLPVAIGKRAEDPGVRQAYQLIEELMLLANETVAQFFQEKNIPTVYRVHAPPDEQKLERFARLCEALAIPFDVAEAQDPKRIGEMLKEFADHPQAHILRMLLLRSLKQATYDVVNVGHFGLASKAYLHFTSPIRRYPDLLVHRSTHAVVQGKRRTGDEEKLPEAARLSSENERRAMEIEREIVDIYRCVFMRDRIGERYEGTVTALVGTGAFVMLDDPFVDVLMRFEDLGGDRYEIDDDGLSAVSERARDVIRLGDRITVQIIDAAIVRRTVYAKRVGHVATEGNTARGARTGAAGSRRTGGRDKPRERGEREGRDRGTTRDDRPRKGKHGSTTSTAAAATPSRRDKSARKGKKPGRKRR